MKNQKPIEDLLAGVDTKYLSESEKATLIARAKSTEYIFDLIFSAAASMKKAICKFNVYASKLAHLA
ncbi:hypothetical protein MSP8887_01834 [Marinomonas spartinae]|uniref:Uncharacterized protein n=1 Tax=Marinomonas spartinae TaxID=1792290 RepID=A0A1A8TS11_9GAMM|nr:hypothetical protein [Marinomonas spartinae]SBS32984.1 hypothetical protein MSP8887_01834 [Marinomonas spartinae]SBS35758.1 hypothetical protein MSP8886_03472 [Marinomonas spartinae]